MTSSIIIEMHTTGELDLDINTDDRDQAISMLKCALDSVLKSNPQGPEDVFITDSK